jgi:hypothetical protein
LEKSETLVRDGFEPTASATREASDAVERSEASQPAQRTETSPGSRPSGSQAATAHDAQQLGFALGWARKQALACHEGGRAGGTVNVEIEFAAEGRVSEVVLHGEPIASAPVGRCIESYFKAMLIPSFSGPAFAVKEQLTLR